MKIALKIYFDRQQAELERRTASIDTLEVTPKKFSVKNEPSVNILTGKEEHMTTIGKLRATAEKEILQAAPTFKGNYASMLSIRKALDRGIMMKVIIWKITTKNKPRIKDCLEHGGDMRLTTNKEELSFFIRDEEELLVGIQHRGRSEERVNVLIRNEPLLHILKDFFFKLWNKARPLTLDNL